MDSKKSTKDKSTEDKSTEDCLRENKDTTIKKAITVEKTDEQINGEQTVIKGQVIKAKEGEEVFLHIYDLSNGLAKSISQQILGFQVDGVWHTSIEVFGNEYCFQNGLCCYKPGAINFGTHVERVSLGITECTAEQMSDFFAIAKDAWSPEKYDLLKNNCNHFSNFLANFLVEKNIPEHILELPEKVESSPGFQMLFKNTQN